MKVQKTSGNAEIAVDMNDYKDRRIYKYQYRDPKDDKEHTYLLSYPRSGNHWFRWCYRFITKRYIHTGERLKAGEIKNLGDIGLIYVLPKDKKWIGPAEQQFPGIPELQDARLIKPPCTISTGGEMYNLYTGHIIEGTQNVEIVKLDEPIDYKTCCSSLADSFLKCGISPNEAIFGNIQFSSGHIYIDENYNLYCIIAQYGDNPKVDNWSIMQGIKDIRDTSLSHYHYGYELLTSEGKVIRTKHMNKNVDTNCIKLLLIVRNYKEAIISEMKQHATSIINWSSIKEEVNKYISTLVTYDKYPYEKKIIYYEDMISNPSKTLEESINNFSGRNSGLSDDDMKENLDSLLENYETHFEESISSYKRGTGSALSGGKSGLFHSLEKGKGHELYDFIENHILQNAPEIYKKYLQRYRGDN